MPEPSNDIGAFYKLLGAFTIIGAVVLFGLSLKMEHTLTKIDGAFVLGLLVAGIALIRPDKLGEWIKDFADWLPFINYRKPDA